jgi:transmembrane sensor
MVALDQELGLLDAEHQHDVTALLEVASRNVVAIDGNANSIIAPRVARHRNHAVRSLQGSRRIVTAVAASVVLMGAVHWLGPLFGLTGQSFATGVGEQRTIALADGSIVQLNTNSRLRVNLSEKQRDIRLLNGEAIFKVHRDSARPFRVLTGDAVIQAIGTEFNVHSGTGRTNVSVLEGAVRISTSNDQALPVGSSAQRETQLAAGEEASIVTGRIIKNKAPDVSETVAWRQRRLIFRADTLGDIASEFNRYNRAPQVRLNNPALAQRRYTGTFDADDPGALALLLSQEADLAIDSTENEIVVHYRR